MATQVSLTDGAVASAGALAIQTNGTTQAVSISTGQVATLAQNPILTSGTANGVAYLNGSKAVTSGSALTFDGTNFATTGTASATKMIPTGGSATGNGMYLPASNTLAWSNNGSETMRLDSAGNLGLGVTPSAWGTGSSMDVGTQTSVHYSGSVGTLLGKNLYYNAGYKYKATGTARAYVQDDGGHSWSIAASGTAGNAITFTQAMTLDASGNLSLGTTSPISSNLFTASSTASNIGIFNSTVSTSGGGGIRVAYNGTTELWLGYYGFVAATGTQVSDAGMGSRDSLLLDAGSTAIKMSVGGSEKARIDSSGNLLVGVTSFGNSSGGVQLNSGTVGAQLKTSATATTSWNHYQLYNANGNVGSISTSGSTTTYSTSSDYRLKENITPMVDALAKVAALKPCVYTWKVDGLDGEGFIAHELAEVCPQAVIGEKDGIDEEGNPVYQGIDTSFLVATLTAAIQEQQALIASQSELITQLQADVAALKGQA